MVVSAASVRAINSSVSISPRSWAARVAKSPIPMFVGDVRMATTRSGVVSSQGDCASVCAAGCETASVIRARAEATAEAAGTL